MTLGLIRGYDSFSSKKGLQSVEWPFVRSPGSSNGSRKLMSKNKLRLFFWLLLIKK
jgi:hypothetical protein